MSTRIKNWLIHAVYQSRLSRIWPQALAGCGAILALHRVRPDASGAFAPNQTLEVTPIFLDQTLRSIRELGLDIVSLDEVHRRLTAGETSRRFICFTLDDGYIDNYTHAWPVFRKHEAPFSIFLTSGLLDHTAVFWWLLLETVIRRESEVSVKFSGVAAQYRTRTIQEKIHAYRDLHGRFRKASLEECMMAGQQLVDRYRADPVALCRAEGMTWAMAREITEGGLGTIEAHTVNHMALSRQEPSDIHTEMAESCARIKEQTGRAPRHFAYPFGDALAAGAREFELLRSMPLLTASTMREGMLWPKNVAALTSLPRLALNGLYQSPGYVELLLSGVMAFASSPIRRSMGA